jgi:hypothetical protein
MLLAARLQNDETGTIRSVMKRAIITTQFESSSAMKLLHHIAKHKCTSQAYRSSRYLMTESMTAESKEDTIPPLTGAPASAGEVGIRDWRWSDQNLDPARTASETARGQGRWKNGSRNRKQCFLVSKAVQTDRPIRNNSCQNLKVRPTSENRIMLKTISPQACGT